MAQHFLMKHGITVIRRLRKTDNLRVARATGATIVNRTEEITEKDIGLGAGLFEVKHIYSKCPKNDFSGFQTKNSNLIQWNAEIRAT